MRDLGFVENRDWGRIMIVFNAHLRSISETETKDGVVLAKHFTKQSVTLRKVIEDNVEGGRGPTPSAIPLSPRNIG